MRSQGHLPPTETARETGFRDFSTPVKDLSKKFSKKKIDLTP
jgi:hypothetical protein